jgi:catechol 2,3-dioxygenase-like lactoylglutathione lyase family enzyme
MTLKIKAINHVQVTVPPFLEQACRTFYGDILQLEEIEKPEPLKSRGGAWFQIGEVQLHMSLEPDADGTASKRHICYEVENLEVARAYFKDRGIAITDEATEPSGLKRFFVRDPAGNHIEIGAL